MIQGMATASRTLPSVDPLLNTYVEGLVVSGSGRPPESLALPSDHPAQAFSQLHVPSEWGANAAEETKEAQVAAIRSAQIEQLLRPPFALGNKSNPIIHAANLYRFDPLRCSADSARPYTKAELLNILRNIVPQLTDAEAEQMRDMKAQICSRLGMARSRMLQFLQEATPISGSLGEDVLNSDRLELFLSRAQQELLYSNIIGVRYPGSSTVGEAKQSMWNICYSDDECRPEGTACDNVLQICVGASRPIPTREEPTIPAEGRVFLQPTFDSQLRKFEKPSEVGKWELMVDDLQFRPLPARLDAQRFAKEIADSKRQYVTIVRTGAFPLDVDSIQQRKFVTDLIRGPLRDAQQKQPPEPLYLNLDSIVTNLAFSSWYRNTFEPRLRSFYQFNNVTYKQMCGWDANDFGNDLLTWIISDTQWNNLLNIFSALGPIVVLFAEWRDSPDWLLRSPKQQRDVQTAFWNRLADQLSNSFTARTRPFKRALGDTLNAVKLRTSSTVGGIKSAFTGSVAGLALYLLGDQVSDKRTRATLKSLAERQRQDETVRADLEEEDREEDELREPRATYISKDQQAELQEEAAATRRPTVAELGSPAALARRKLDLQVQALSTLGQMNMTGRDETQVRKLIEEWIQGLQDALRKDVTRARELQFKVRELIFFLYRNLRYYIVVAPWDANDLLAWFYKWVIFPKVFNSDMVRQDVYWTDWVLLSLDELWMIYLRHTLQSSIRNATDIKSLEVKSEVKLVAPSTTASASAVAPTAAASAAAAAAAAPVAPAAPATAPAIPWEKGATPLTREEIEEIRKAGQRSIFRLRAWPALTEVWHAALGRVAEQLNTLTLVVPAELDIGADKQRAFTNWYHDSFATASAMIRAKVGGMTLDNDQLDTGDDDSKYPSMQHIADLSELVKIWAVTMAFAFSAGILGDTPAKFKNFNNLTQLQQTFNDTVTNGEAVFDEKTSPTRAEAFDLYVKQVETLWDDKKPYGAPGKAVSDDWADAQQESRLTLEQMRLNLSNLLQAIWKVTIIDTSKKASTPLFANPPSSRPSDPSSIDVLSEPIFRMDFGNLLSDRSINLFNDPNQHLRLMRDLSLMRFRQGQTDLFGQFQQQSTSSVADGYHPPLKVFTTDFRTGKHLASWIGQRTRISTRLFPQYQRKGQRDRVDGIRQISERIVNEALSNSGGGKVPTDRHIVSDLGSFEAALLQQLILVAVSPGEEAKRQAEVLSSSTSSSASSSATSSSSASAPAPPPAKPTPERQAAQRILAQTSTKYWPDFTETVRVRDTDSHFINIWDSFWRFEERSYENEPGAGFDTLQTDDQPSSEFYYQVRLFLIRHGIVFGDDETERTNYIGHPQLIAVRLKKEETATFQPNGQFRDDVFLRNEWTYAVMLLLFSLTLTEEEVQTSAGGLATASVATSFLKDWKIPINVANRAKTFKPLDIPVFSGRLYTIGGLPSLLLPHSVGTDQWILAALPAPDISREKVPYWTSVSMQSRVDTLRKCARNQPEYYQVPMDSVEYYFGGIKVWTGNHLGNSIRNAIDTDLPSEQQEEYAKQLYPDPKVDRVVGRNNAGPILTPNPPIYADRGNRPISSKLFAGPAVNVTFGLHGTAGPSAEQAGRRHELSRIAEALTPNLINFGSRLTEGNRWGKFKDQLVRQMFQEARSTSRDLTVIPKSLRWYNALIIGRDRYDPQKVMERAAGLMVQQAKRDMVALDTDNVLGDFVASDVPQPVQQASLMLYKMSILNEPLQLFSPVQSVHLSALKGEAPAEDIINPTGPSTLSLQRSELLHPAQVLMDGLRWNTLHNWIRATFDDAESPAIQESILISNPLREYWRDMWDYLVMNAYDWSILARQFGNLGRTLEDFNTDYLTFRGQPRTRQEAQDIRLFTEAFESKDKPDAVNQRAQSRFDPNAYNQVKDTEFDRELARRMAFDSSTKSTVPTKGKGSKVAPKSAAAVTATLGRLPTREELEKDDTNGAINRVVRSMTVFRRTQLIRSFIAMARELRFVTTSPFEERGIGGGATSFRLLRKELGASVHHSRYLSQFGVTVLEQDMWKRLRQYQDLSTLEPEKFSKAGGAGAFWRMAFEEEANLATEQHFLGSLNADILSESEKGFKFPDRLLVASVSSLTSRSEYNTSLATVIQAEIELYKRDLWITDLSYNDFDALRKAIEYDNRNMLRLFAQYNATEAFILATRVAPFLALARLLRDAHLKPLPAQDLSVANMRTIGTGIGAAGLPMTERMLWEFESPLGGSGKMGIVFYFPKDAKTGQPQDTIQYRLEQFYSWLFVEFFLDQLRKAKFPAPAVDALWIERREWVLRKLFEIAVDYPVTNKADWPYMLSRFANYGILNRRTNQTVKLDDQKFLAPLEARRAEKRRDLQIHGEGEQVDPVLWFIQMYRIRQQMTEVLEQDKELRLETATSKNHASYIGRYLAMRKRLPYANFRVMLFTAALAPNVVSPSAVRVSPWEYSHFMDHLTRVFVRKPAMAAWDAEQSAIREKAARDYPDAIQFFEVISWEDFRRMAQVAWRLAREEGNEGFLQWLNRTLSIRSGGAGGAAIATPTEEFEYFVAPRTMTLNERRLWKIYSKAAKVIVRNAYRELRLELIRTLLSAGVNIPADQRDRMSDKDLIDAITLQTVNGWTSYFQRLERDYYQGQPLTLLAYLTKYFSALINTSLSQLDSLSDDTIRDINKALEGTQFGPGQPGKPAAYRNPFFLMFAAAETNYRLLWAMLSAYRAYVGQRQLGDQKTQLPQLDFNFAGGAPLRTRAQAVLSQSYEQREDYGLATLLSDRYVDRFPALEVATDGRARGDDTSDLDGPIERVLNEVVVPVLRPIVDQVAKTGDTGLLELIQRELRLEPFTHEWKLLLYALLVESKSKYEWNSLINNLRLRAGSGQPSALIESVKRLVDISGDWAAQSIDRQEDRLRTLERIRQMSNRNAAALPSEVQQLLFKAAEDARSALVQIEPKPSYAPY